jgi:TPR repeat protein
MQQPLTAKRRIAEGVFIAVAAGMIVWAITQKLTPQIQQQRTMQLSATSPLSSPENLPNTQPFRPATKSGISKTEKQALEAFNDHQFDTAYPLFLRAANQGSADAMYHLGLLLKDGHGVPQDIFQARQWFEKAAALGHAAAMTHLGFLYTGAEKEIPEDRLQERQWYEKAAALGDTEAMYGIGYLYEYGYGVTRDYQQARLWYEKAAAAGFADAMDMLGLMYTHGYGVSKDYDLARKWFSKAEAAGASIRRSHSEPPWVGSPND